MFFLGYAPEKIFRYKKLRYTSTIVHHTGVKFQNINLFLQSKGIKNVQVNIKKVHCSLNQNLIVVLASMMNKYISTKNYFLNL